MFKIKWEGDNKRKNNLHTHTQSLEISAYEHHFSYGPHAWTHPYTAQLDSCRESKAGAETEGTTVCTAACTLIKEYSVADGRGCLMKETPGEGEARTCWTLTVIPPLYLNNATTKEVCFYTLHWAGFAKMKLVNTERTDVVSE